MHPTRRATPGPTAARHRRGRAAGLLLLAACLGAAAPSEARRLALVIGNDSYQHVDALSNARADATAVAGALAATNFKVTLKKDVTLTAMKDALRAFKGEVAGGDEVVFYYAGHGVQLDGNNYIIPVDAIGESADQLKDYSVPLQRVLDDMQEQKARFTLAIVDACRNNPFKGNGRALRTPGLAPVQAADGQAVLYSAGAGQEALDNLGSGDRDPNGVFTRVLIKVMRVPGLPFDDVIHQVRNQVVQLAKSINADQTPGYYSQFTGDFYFIPPAAGTAASLPRDTAAGTVTAAAGPPPDELAAYKAAEQANSADAWNLFLRRYPNSAYATAAQIRLDALKQKGKAALPLTTPLESTPSEAKAGESTARAATPTTTAVTPELPRAHAAPGAGGPVDPAIVGSFQLDGVFDDYDQHYTYSVTADGHFHLVMEQQESGTYQAAFGSFHTMNAKTHRVRSGSYRAAGTSGIALTNATGQTALYYPVNPSGPVNPMNPIMLGVWRATLLQNALTWTLTLQNNPDGTFQFSARAEDNGSCDYANNQWHWVSAVSGQTDGGTYRIVDAHSVEFSGLRGTTIWRRL